MLDGTVMGDAVVAELQALDGGMTPDQVAQLRTAWRAICDAIVTHVKANAVVDSTGSAAVTTAPGTAPVTTTGTVS